jgi:hypothetical protein
MVAHADLGDIMSRIASGGSIFIVERNDNGAQLKMRVVGKITFTDAEDDVKSVSGRSSILEKRDGVTRRIDLQPDGANGIMRTYTVNAKPQPFDAEGRKWLAKLIPDLLRETTMNAEARVANIQAKGGAIAVLDEIDRIHADHARGKYLEILVKKGPIDDKLTPRLFAAIKVIDSDFARRNVLLAVIGKQALSSAQQVSLLGAVAEMDSAFEQRSVLNALAPTLNADPAVMQAWRVAVGRMDSDFEIRSVIDQVAKRTALTPAQLDSVIDASNSLDSDFERAQALKALLPHMEKASAPQVEAYLKSARGIDSAFELRGVVTALIKRVALEKPAFPAVFQSIDAIDSDFEKRAALETVAKKLPRDAELVARYRKSARSLGQFERAQAEKAIDSLNM